jgi:hypothetical protein
MARKMLQPLELLPPGDGRTRRMAVLAPPLRHMMAKLLVSQTDDHVRETLGIGFKTWMKVRDGRPVRESLARRLIERTAPSSGE